MAVAPFIAGRISLAIPTSKYDGLHQYGSSESCRRRSSGSCRSRSSLAMGMSTRYIHQSSRRTLTKGPTNGARITMAWQDCTARVEVDVPLPVAWELWSDREGLSRWMPWIASIKVSKDEPEMSEWTLKYNAFGQDFEFSWLARNLQPIRYQKIHWRSVDGLPNRGAVRFYPRGPSSCAIELTLSYEVPAILTGLASAVSPLVERILQGDLERFVSFAREYQSRSSTK